MVRLLACGIAAALFVSCAPQLRFSVSGPRSYRDLGYSSAMAQVGFMAVDITSLKGGGATPYRALDSDGSGAWMDEVSVKLVGPGGTNRIYSLTRLLGKSPEPFRRYTLDPMDGTNGRGVDDGPLL